MAIEQEQGGNRVITGERLTKAAVAGLAAFLTLRLAVMAVDTADRVHDFVTEDLLDVDVPEAFHNPPATIEVDDTNAVFEAISSRLVHEKTERVENIDFNYDNPDQSWASSWFAGARLPEDFVLSGEVTATVELSDIAASGIQPTPDGQGLLITLPPAEVAATQIDDDIKFDLEYGVYNDATGARETEEVVRAEAKTAVTDTALGNGLLESAQTDAAKSVRGLAVAILAGRGISVAPEDIVVEFVDDEPLDAVALGEQPGKTLAEERTL